MDLKFGLATPSQLWSLQWADRQALLNEIDDGGFTHVFLADHVSFRNGAGADGFVEAAALAQLHPSLGVMISIYLLPLRHPLPVARQLASMARVAPGRFTFGVGIGGEDPHELAVCGVNPRQRGVRANESLTIIQGLLRGETVSFSGQAFEIDSAVIRPTPAIAIPTLVGGRSDAACNDRSGSHRSRPKQRGLVSRLPALGWGGLEQYRDGQGRGQIRHGSVL